MKDWLVFGIIFAALLLVSGSLFSITDILVPEERSPGTLTDSMAACQALLQETKQNYPHSTWTVAECRTCPAIVKVVPTRCYLACGTPCPAGAQCNYPPQINCQGGCTGGLCGGGIEYFDPSYRGCHEGGASAPASFLIMLEDNEIGTAQQTFAENKYNTTCFPTTTNPPPTGGGLPSSFPFTAIAIFLIIGGLLLAYVGRKK